LIIIRSNLKFPACLFSNSSACFGGLDALKTLWLEPASTLLQDAREEVQQNPLLVTTSILSCQNLQTFGMIESSDPYEPRHILWQPCHILPEQIGSLEKLKFLVLHRAWLSGSVPHSTGSLQKLRVLDLSGAHLTGTVTMGVCMPYLTHLHLHQNNPKP